LRDLKAHFGSNVSEGVSEVIGNLVIASTIILITIISTSVAMNFIEIQAAQAEFEGIKDSMLILADIIEEVGSRVYSSGYVKFNCRYGRVDFLKDDTHIEVFLNSSKIVDVYTSSLRYTCGVRFSVSEEYVRGEGSGIFMDEFSHLVTVKLASTSGFPSIILRGGCVRVVDKGELYLRSRGFNVTVYELVLVRVRVGLTVGSDSINVKAYGKGVTLNTLFIEKPSSIELFVDGLKVDCKSITAPAVLNVAIVEVEISTV